MTREQITPRQLIVTLCILICVFAGSALAFKQLALVFWLAILAVSVLAAAVAAPTLVGSRGRLVVVLVATIGLIAVAIGIYIGYNSPR
ncbi:MAG TPA: hypothetical protein VFY89_06680 [Ktedonobacterales bacterium]